MTDINVFEIAFTENSSLGKSEIKRGVKESLKKSIASKAKSIKKESIKFNKIRFTEDADEFSDVQPNDDIMVVYSDEIKPDMTEEEVAEAAEELVGATVCKCGVCGANYICNCNHEDSEEELIFDDETDEDFAESFLFREDDEIEATAEVADDEPQCPVCDATENQIEVGEIAPADEADTEETEEVVDDVEITDDDFDVDAPVDESCDVKATKKPMRKPMHKQSRESINHRPVAKRHVVKKSNESVVRKPVQRKPAHKVARKPVVENKTRKPVSKVKATREINFNENAFTRLLNKFVKENYSNVRNVKITKGKAVKSELRFEGIVTTKSGKTRPIAFETRGFNLKEGVNKFKLIEKGPFTESARKSKTSVPFVLECKVKGNNVLPTAFKCKYTVKSEGKWYECTGKYTITD